MFFACVIYFFSQFIFPVSDSQGAAEVISTIASTPSSKVGNVNNANNANAKVGWSDDLSGSKRRTEQVSALIQSDLCIAFIQPYLALLILQCINF